MSKIEDLSSKQFGYFIFIKKIGDGGYSSVYQAVDERNKAIVAVKVIQKKSIDHSTKLKQLLNTQIKILKKVQNKNVINFVGNFHSDRFIFIGTQYCDGGTLEEHLDINKTISEDEAVSYIKQILNGFKGLHQVNAMHRDLKLSNVLLSKGVCKIADLGFSRQLNGGELATTMLGTSVTMAPQILNGDRYSFEADIYSIGVIFYQMLSGGKYPYVGKSDYDILKKIRLGPPEFQSFTCSEDAKDFITKCLKPDPKQRINWSDIYSHPLFAENQIQFLYGTSNTKVNISENKEFYHTHKLIELESLASDFMANNRNVFENDGIMMKSGRFQEIVAELNGRKARNERILKYEYIYIKARNNCMFIFKFILPYAATFKKIQLSHSTLMFLLCKKSFMKIGYLSKLMKEKANPFALKENFEDFLQSPNYKNLSEQVVSDMQKTKQRCLMFQKQIVVTSLEIQRQFDLDHCDKPIQETFENLVKNIGKQYSRLLAHQINSVQKQVKKNIIKVINALSYYLMNTQADVEQFQKILAATNYKQEQMNILEKYCGVSGKIVSKTSTK